MSVLRESQSACKKDVMFGAPLLGALLHGEKRLPCTVQTHTSPTQPAVGYANRHLWEEVTAVPIFQRNCQYHHSNSCYSPYVYETALQLSCPPGYSPYVFETALQLSCQLAGHYLVDLWVRFTEDRLAVRQARAVSKSQVKQVEHLAAALTSAQAKTSKAERAMAEA
eukprot:3241773-Rhodomonas_salina.1